MRVSVKLGRKSVEMRPCVCNPGELKMTLFMIGAKNFSETVLHFVNTTVN